MDSVIYCDPPYIPTSKTANFTASGKPFTPDDHRALVTALLDVNRQHGTRSVISNSDTPETRQIYLLSISTPSEFDVPLAPKPAIWPVK